MAIGVTQDPVRLVSFECSVERERLARFETADRLLLEDGSRVVGQVCRRDSVGLRREAALQASDLVGCLDPNSRSISLTELRLVVVLEIERDTDLVSYTARRDLIDAVPVAVRSRTIASVDAAGRHQRLPFDRVVDRSSSPGVRTPAGITENPVGGVGFELAFEREPLAGCERCGRLAFQNRSRIGDQIRRYNTDCLSRNTTCQAVDSLGRLDTNSGAIPLARLSEVVIPKIERTTNFTARADWCDTIDTVPVAVRSRTIAGVDAVGGD
ncbi:hypothetical protein ACFO3C_20525 [Halostagnicola sp. GCM10023398]|uniref:hypothetical protein n=1 Tax=unclassified Halostagnicola TaxID=2642439 RepID=UPI003623EEC7